jgi:multiple sugar transport system permease protein
MEDRSMIAETRRDRLAVYVGVATFLLFSWIPFYWLIRTSFLENLVAVKPDSPFIPFLSEGFTITGYIEVWSQYPFDTWFANSIIVSLGATTVALILAIPTAYAFARHDFPGKRLLFYTVVTTIMFPAIVLTIPVYEIFYMLKLLDTLLGITIALAIFVQPLCIWLLQGFFRQGLPDNIEEAAQMDGLSRVEAFFRIVLPLSAPAVAVTALFAFLSGWNNFTWVYILTQSEGTRTAIVAVHFIMASDVLRDWNTLMAAVTILIIPPIIFYGLAQRYVGEGLGSLT